VATLAALDGDRRSAYTVFVLNAASESARQALEVLMSTAPYGNAFVDGWIAKGVAKGETEGKARGMAQGQLEGEARIVLRVLSARGLPVTAEIRQRVMSCTDTGQLETWGDRAATATTLDEVFAS
jgi:hypothetical protein